MDVKNIKLILIGINIECEYSDIVDIYCYMRE